MTFPNVKALDIPSLVDSKRAVGGQNSVGIGKGEGGEFGGRNEGPERGGGLCPEPQTRFTSGLPSGAHDVDAISVRELISWPGSDRCAGATGPLPPA